MDAPMCNICSPPYAFFTLCDPYGHVDVEYNTNLFHYKLVWDVPLAQRIFTVNVRVLNHHICFPFCLSGPNATFKTYRDYKETKTTQIYCCCSCFLGVFL